MIFEWISSFASFFLNFAIVAFLLVVLVLILLYTFQNKLLYMPVIGDMAKSPQQNPVGMRSPGDRNLPFEPVLINTVDGERLRGWLCLQPNSKEVPTVVYMHENAGNIGTRVYFLEYYFRKLQVNIMLIAYRGYSDSTGIPTERGLMNDGEAIVKYVLEREDIDRTKIFLHGRSLGGAVASYVITQQVSEKIAGIILENTFTSISSMVDVIFPKLRWFKTLVQRNFWPTIDRVPNIRQPILFILSMKDEIVPPEQMVTLLNKAHSSKFVDKFVIPDGNHNANWAQNPDEYFQAISQFIYKVTQQIG